jgi:hypothetical protein
VQKVETFQTRVFVWGNLTMSRFPTKIESTKGGSGGGVGVGGVESTIGASSRPRNWDWSEGRPLWRKKPSFYWKITILQYKCLVNVNLVSNPSVG